jgi:hypothetical protein
MSKRQIQKDVAQEKLPEPGAVDESPALDNYKVGYGRPPKHTQFRKGQSGNPKGRPQGRANAKTIVSRVINEKVTVRDGDQARAMTKLEGMLQAHLVKAIKGDARSASLVIGLVTKLGLLADVEKETFATLSEEDHAILEEYVRNQTESAERKPVDKMEN